MPLQYTVLPGVTGCWYYHAYQSTTIHVRVFFEFLRRGWEEGTHTTNLEPEIHF